MSSLSQRIPSVVLNTTFTHEIQHYVFGDLSPEICREIWKDGRPFSHFIEKYIAQRYPLIHVPGCKSHDFVDKQDATILYDEKTFTSRGCSFCPSNMLGQGREFDNERFISHCQKLIFCIVSNVDFPTIKIKFVKGEDLRNKYPSGKIPSSDFVEFFH